MEDFFKTKNLPIFLESMLKTRRYKWRSCECGWSGGFKLDFALLKRCPTFLPDETITFFCRLKAGEEEKMRKILGGAELSLYKQNPEADNTAFIGKWFSQVNKAQCQEEVNEVLLKAKRELWHWLKGSEGCEGIEQVIAFCEEKLPRLPLAKDLPEVIVQCKLCQECRKSITPGLKFCGELGGNRQFNPNLDPSPEWCPHKSLPRWRYHDSSLEFPPS
ncbi:hypothetical protein A2Y83_04500 [Candidatus Falkowbacteria bacterium RBG_13_39_14]|uniref:Uncharacterized protein n=1 Tax=Candidatus Falkowbacteria bacterium RBG_13_39_14 TaxID=1797985 RepID=A0A1F5S485_9BACT|nr:MAG: hypothetical protein A2Y83_04500 [Candidatus Falkowbacteria bacterium RBG_13_39_14]